MKRSVKPASLFATGVLVGWLMTGLFQSPPGKTMGKPVTAPEESAPGPGKNINRYGEQIKRLA